MNFSFACTARPEYFRGELVEVGAVVEDVRTVFERKNDTSIYIPTFIARKTS
jgi:hypothetical protein